MRKTSGLVIINQGKVVTFGDDMLEAAHQLFALVHYSAENHRLKGSPNSGDHA